MAEGQLALLVETNDLEGGNLGARRVLLQLVLTPAIHSHTAGRPVLVLPGHLR